MKFLIIGGGISGIAAAKVVRDHGHVATIFEKSHVYGGVWATAYDGVRLQNTYDQYRLSDYPWPFQPDLHPSKDQIMAYIASAVEHFKIDARTQHEVLQLEGGEDGRPWTVRYSVLDNVYEDVFDYVIVASGQYSCGKFLPLVKCGDFQGAIISERDVKDWSVFEGREVVVVGFGKSALDMVTAASSRAIEVHHVFRSPRWALREYIFGIHFTSILWTRFATILIPWWVHPSALERFLHAKCSLFVTGFWKALGFVFWMYMRSESLFRGREAKRRLEAVTPRGEFVSDLRSALPVVPKDYYRNVAKGMIIPHPGEIQSFKKNSVKLLDGSSIPCDLALYCTGNSSPSFPFLPRKYAQILERERDGTQLYRHILHPDMSNLAFASFNTSFHHMPCVEIGMLWLMAVIDKNVVLPSREQMIGSMNIARDWKRENITHEPSLLYAVNVRFQQYLDCLLIDLQVSPYRKLPNVFLEVFGKYSPSDYRTVKGELLEKTKLCKAHHC